MASIGDTLQNLKLSGDEVQRLTKAFQDDEFKKLFAQYAADMQDPANLAESEAYLRQLESEGKAEATYGAGAVLVVPDPAFVVKTRSSAGSGGAKVFINVCTSAKVAAAVASAAAGGQNWSIPFSVSAPHEEADKAGTACKVVDFCVNEQTLAVARENTRFHALLVQTALEEAGKRLSLELDAAAVSFPNRKFMGANPPRVQMLGPQSGAGGGGGGAGAGSAPSARASNSSAPSTATGAAAPSSGQRSAFSFDAKKKTPAAGSRKVDAAAAEPPPPFQYSVLHQMRPDLGSTWSDARTASSATTPAALLVRIELPGMTSAAGVELETAKTTLRVVVGEKELLVPLPFEVDDSAGSAKFDKNKSRLEVRLPVVQPPPRPAVPAFSTAEQASQPEAEVAAEAPRPAAAAKQEAAPADPGGAAQPQPGPAEGASATESSTRMTENEERWRAIHAPAGPPATSVGAAQQDGTSSSAENVGPSDGDVAPSTEAPAEAADGAAATVGRTGQVTAPARLVLKPVLRTVEAVALE